ncbi:substrate-binding domain-containing protein [Paenibacillus sp.]|uniref:substrate-binding domain-containing protein n=1 Tax=Paenibacillus sp. TaxID=58172 RepID=UPI002810A231|nr:substrate-binding domain-containing protein [Paenibacillus sp.]
MKKVTLQMIADQLQISKSLVSKALANQKGVNEETKEKVRLTAMNMGYMINSSALSISASRTGNVAVVVPRSDLKDFEYWGRILHGIEKALSEKSFSMILSGIDPNVATSEGLPSCVTDRKVDGALVLGAVPLAYILAIQVTGIPVVLVDVPHFVQMKLDHVLAENNLGGYDATKYLLDRNHRRIGFVGDVSYASSFAARHAGFLDAVKDFKTEREVEIEAVSFTDARGDSIIPYSLGDADIERIRETGLTGLVCGNDPVAFEVMQSLERVGLSCPQDVSLIGFDNVQKCQWVTPALTSIDACKETMGTRSAEMLFRRMQQTDFRAEHVRITTEIIERESVRSL